MSIRADLIAAVTKDIATNYANDPGKAFDAVAARYADAPGRLTADDVEAYLDEIAFEYRVAHRYIAREVVETFDTNGDGSIDKAEWLALIAQNQPRSFAMSDATARPILDWLAHRHRTSLLTTELTAAGMPGAATAVGALDWAAITAWLDTVVTKIAPAVLSLITALLALLSGV